MQLHIPTVWTMTFILSAVRTSYREFHLLHSCCSKNNKLQRWRKNGQAPDKLLWNVSLISVILLICLGKCYRSTAYLYHEMWTDHLSTSSSSHTHSEKTLQCAGFGNGLASAWSKIGNKSSWTWSNREELPWGHCTLQARNVGSLASKCQTSHVESSCWCPMLDGKARNCLEDSKTALHFLHCHWYVSNGICNSMVCCGTWD